MSDARAFLYVYVFSAVLLVVAEGIALATWGNGRILAGLAVGYGMGLAPLLSWQWLIRSLLHGRGRVAWVISLLVLKFALYGTVLYFLITGRLVDGMAAGVGLTLIPLVLPVVFLARPHPVEQVS